jgi:DNA helicase-2/ATP-dependent DNA helicase PcrA
MRMLILWRWLSMEFNPQQQNAIETNTGAFSVIASPGSGKSTVLVHRVQNLVNVHNIRQEDILCITFTKNTRQNLQKKLKGMFLDRVLVHTFHSLSGKLLVQEGVVKREPSDSPDGNNGLNKYALMAKFKVVYKEIKNKDYDDILSFISYNKSFMRGYKDEFVQKESNFSENDLRKFYKIYEDYKKSINYYDFDDLLLECNKLMDNHPEISYKYVLVDEFQDTNMIQNVLLEKWCKSKNLFVVFDYRQSLYRFNGANPEYCMDFYKNWNATVINLDTNYRSAFNIVNNSNSFIKKYYGKYKFYSDGIPSSSVNGQIKLISNSNRTEEAQKVTAEVERLIGAGEDVNQIAILYRLNSHSENIESLFKVKNIPYDIKGDSSFFKRKEIKSLMAILKLVQNSSDDEAFETLFAARLDPLKFFSKADKDLIDKYKMKNDLSYYETLSSISFPEAWKNRNCKAFVMNIFDLKIKKDKSHSIAVLIDLAKQGFKIKDYLTENYQDEEVKDRLQSIETLKQFIRGDDLSKFIEFTEESIEKKTKKEVNGIKMMSIHASKGCEWKHVIIVGIESEKFPHSKSNLIDEAMLFFVGISRPTTNLTLSQIGTNNQFIDEYFNK